MAQLKDLIVNGASRLIGDTTVNKIQITSLSAPTSAGGTTYGLGTSGNILKTNGSSAYWGTLNVSDLTNDTGFITGMYIGSYGNSTFAEIEEAYTSSKIVYCKASSNANPATGTQGRMAFLAYVNINTNNNTVNEFEFQYYRSVSTHTDAQQGDQVFIYKLNRNTGWSVTTREASSKVAANNGLTTSYNNNTITISHANTAITAQSTQAVYPIAIDAYGHITGYGTSPTTLSGYGITDAKIASGVITLGSNTITPKTVQTAVTKPTAATNKWVSAIGQNTNGVIDVSYATLDTSGTWSGNAATATKATQDESGNNIKSSYAASFSISDHTITLKNKNGTSLGTVTVPDNNTATAVDNILDGSNSGTAITYAPYTTQQTKLSFDTSTTAPTRSDRLNLNGYFYATKVYGAVWNDYAEYRITKDQIEPGRCIIETGNDDLILSTTRLQPGGEIVSDTFGFSIGETEKAKTPVATTGRVLAYIYEGRQAAKLSIGKPVCSGPNGTVSIMSDEEYQKYGYCAIGTISSVPDYKEWGTNHIKVNGRVWIRIR